MDVADATSGCGQLGGADFACGYDAEAKHVGLADQDRPVPADLLDHGDMPVAGGRAQYSRLEHDDAADE